MGMIVSLKKCCTLERKLLIKQLVFLFNKCLKHGYVPESFGLGFICLVPKKANLMSQFEYYKPKTLIVSFKIEYSLTTMPKWLNSYNIAHSITINIPNIPEPKIVAIVTKSKKTTLIKYSSKLANNNLK